MRYQKISVLGKGGEAIVYKYFDKLQNKDVAIKIIARSYNGDADQQSQELEILYQLKKYDGIIQIYNYVLMYDKENSNLQIYIVMELAEFTLD